MMDCNSGFVVILEPHFAPKYSRFCACASYRLPSVTLSSKSSKQELICFHLLDKSKRRSVLAELSRIGPSCVVHYLDASKCVLKCRYIIHYYVVLTSDLFHLSVNCKPLESPSGQHVLFKSLICIILRLLNVCPCDVMYDVVAPKASIRDE